MVALLTPSIRCSLFTCDYCARNTTYNVHNRKVCTHTKHSSPSPSSTGFGSGVFRMFCEPAVAAAAADRIAESLLHFACLGGCVWVYGLCCLCVCVERWAAAIYELYTQSTYRIRRSRTMPRRTLDKMSAIVSVVARSNRVFAEICGFALTGKDHARASFNKCLVGSETEHNSVYIGTAITFVMPCLMLRSALSAHIKRL